MSFDDSGAPPLGQRPSEPRPGKDSLADPRGEDAGGADGKAPAPERCPDCGLPFGEHPEFHMHDGGGGDAAEVNLGDADMDADDLPGQRLDQEIGGDPAEA